MDLLHIHNHLARLAEGSSLLLLRRLALLLVEGSSPLLGRRQALLLVEGSPLPLRRQPLGQRTHRLLVLELKRR